jgi:hypothetical protein
VTDSKAAHLFIAFSPIYDLDLPDLTRLRLHLQLHKIPVERSVRRLPINQNRLDSVRIWFVFAQEEVACPPLASR